MSKLLLNEQPLLVMPLLATKIGLNESLVLQQIHYWLEINRKADKNFKDGYYWTYNTYDKWQEQFPFWSKSTIQRTIGKLEKLNLIVSSNYNKLKIDRTKWYRINYKILANLEDMPCGQNDMMDNVKLTRPLPENKAETKKTIYSFSNENEDCLFPILENTDNEYIHEYVFALESIRDTRHPRVTEEQLRHIEIELEDIEGTDIQEYKEAVYDYIYNLNDNNNGNILSFIKAKKRYFI